MKEGADALLPPPARSSTAADWTSAESLKEAVLAAGEEHGLKLGKAQAPVRVAVTGRTVGLPLFESLEILGKERTLARIDAALAKLAALTPAARARRARTPHGVPGARGLSAWPTPAEQSRGLMPARDAVPAGTSTTPSSTTPGSDRIGMLQASAGPRACLAGYATSSRPLWSAGGRSRTTECGALPRRGGRLPGAAAGTGPGRSWGPRS